MGTSSLPLVLVFLVLWTVRSVSEGAVHSLQLDSRLSIEVSGDEDVFLRLPSGSSQASLRVSYSGAEPLQLSITPLQSEGGSVAAGQRSLLDTEIESVELDENDASIVKVELNPRFPLTSPVILYFDLESTVIGIPTSIIPTILLVLISVVLVFIIFGNELDRYAPHHNN